MRVEHSGLNRVRFPLDARAPPQMGLESSVFTYRTALIAATYFGRTFKSISQKFASGEKSPYRATKAVSTTAASSRLLRSAYSRTALVRKRSISDFKPYVELQSRSISANFSGWSDNRKYFCAAPKSRLAHEAAVVFVGEGRGFSSSATECNDQGKFCDIIRKGFVAGVFCGSSTHI